MMSAFSERCTRWSMGLAASLLVLALVAGCGGTGAKSSGGKKVIVLGFDGMDYSLTKQLMSAGILPNFSRLAKDGSFSPLGTTAPPLSPVAWSTFITGMDPGGHGIFDFVHRDPETMVPYLSTSLTSPAKIQKIGNCQIPVGGGETVLMRKGTPFWEVLEKNGIETNVLRMPANFPPTGTATRELSGMGTPDVLGTYGTYSFYTSVLFPFPGKTISTGKVYEAWPDEIDGVVRAKLYGPKSPFVEDAEEISTDFEVHIDPEDPVAKIVVGDEEMVLQVGEWSDWFPVSMPLDQCLGSPVPTLTGMTRFYLRSVRPEFEMYAAPINFDPMDPATPISTPNEYAAELAEATGRFYTQGMPEETKALTEGVLTPDEFLAQAKIAGDELAEQYRYVLDSFEEGFLFYYFGNLDLVSHIMWRSTDPDHPVYDAMKDSQYGHVIERLYREADAVVGETLDKMDENTRLIVMSDHGFSSWRRSMHLNSWLRDEGYLVLKNPNLAKDPGLYLNVDWSKTRAYGLGLNGLYINLRGREKDGIVDSVDREALIEEIAEKLLEVVDPETGELAITKVYRRDDLQYKAEIEIGPDLVIGYAKGTRGSNESALGEVPKEVFMNNSEDWSGDHGMDHESVPGILFSDQPLVEQATSLQDLAASILAEFGIEGFPEAPTSAP